MMGRQTVDQSQLFYLFNLEEQIPANHLLRRLNPIVTRVLDGQILVDADLKRLAWLRVAHETFWKPLAQKFERAFDCAHRRECPSRECADATAASLSRESRGRATRVDFEGSP